MLNRIQVGVLGEENANTFDDFNTEDIKGFCKAGNQWATSIVKNHLRPLAPPVCKWTLSSVVPKKEELLLLADKPWKVIQNTKYR